MASELGLRTLSADLKCTSSRKFKVSLVKSIKGLASFTNLLLACVNSRTYRINAI